MTTERFLPERLGSRIQFYCQMKKPGERLTPDTEALVMEMLAEVGRKIEQTQPGIEWWANLLDSSIMLMTVQGDS
jgi:hypothetical protein